MSRFCPGQNCDEEAQGPLIPLPIPCVQPLTLCGPLLVCNRRPPWVPTLTKSQATWELTRDRLALYWWLAGGGRWKTSSPASGVDWLCSIDTAGLPQGTWLRLELDLRAHLYLTFPLSCLAPPAPGKIFNKSFAYIAFSGPASGEIWIYQNSQRCTQPMRTLPSTLTHLDGDIVNSGEPHLWAGTLDANWFPLF